MPQEPKSPANSSGMQTKMSAWTPLNHPAANIKIFEERQTLLSKWFDRWSDSQRRAVLQTFVKSCSREQLKFLSLIVSRRLPLQAADFTCELPRALSLYIFSFLDPRSLCRCAQVSWHWKSIVELDQLWMPKCLKLSWCISHSPTPFEQGVWKRHYIQTVQEMRLLRHKTATFMPQYATPNLATINNKHKDQSHAASLHEGRQGSAAQPAKEGLRYGSTKAKPQSQALPPWRHSDRRPKDTLRFNYLDNLSPAEHRLKNHIKSTSLSYAGNPVTAEEGRRKSLSEATYKLRKAKSMMFLTSNYRPQHSPTPAPPTHHPQWASSSNGQPNTEEGAKSLLHSAHWNAGMRPGPIRSAVPQLSAAVLRACQRSQRSSPS